MITVGYIHQGYPERRNIIDVHHKQIKHVKRFDIYKIADFIHFKLISKTNLFYHNTFNDRLCKGNADIYHFFNMVNYGKSPWVSTFETMLPRYEVGDAHIRKSVMSLTRENCKQLIAMSAFNLNMQKQFLIERFPQYAEEILAKTITLFPPQKTNVDKADKSFLGNTLKVLFVGHDFFRKGGRELFYAIERLHKQGANIQLSIVSKLDTDAFVTRTTDTDKAMWKRKISESKFCTYFESKPNTEVMELMKNHHLIAVPSLQETFGYVVLEAQACGTPVLTTSIRAFPEINSKNCGFVVDIPQDAKGVADINKVGYEGIAEILTEGIFQQLSSALQNLHVFEQKGENALQRIKDFHSPTAYAQRLFEVYSK
jgi:glycosyltransferase involved in cell wall biosynthesis